MIYVELQEGEIIAFSTRPQDYSLFTSKVRQVWGEEAWADTRITFKWHSNLDYAVNPYFCYNFYVH